VIQGHSDTALCAATFAVVASGTATLEAGFIGTPMVVVYRMHPVTAFLAWCLIRVPWVGLVNLVAGKQLVPELLQYQVRPQIVAEYALRCLEHAEEAQRIRTALGILRQILGQGESARRAAVSINRFLCPEPACSEAARLPGG
jgi:lipid-A-disaccharide synthase